MIRKFTTILACAQWPWKCWLWHNSFPLNILKRLECRKFLRYYWSFELEHKALEFIEKVKPVIISLFSSSQQNLEQTPLNRSQQLPAPYRTLIDGLKQNYLRENDWTTDNLTNNKWLFNSDNRRIETHQWHVSHSQQHSYSGLRSPGRSSSLWKPLTFCVICCCCFVLIFLTDNSKENALKSVIK